MNKPAALQCQECECLVIESENPFILHSYECKWRDAQAKIEALEKLIKVLEGGG